MATPSLGELSNLGQPVRVNPEPYIIDTKSTIDVLNNAANQKAQYDWKKYLNFQDNLKEVYKNLDDTSALKAAQEDRPFLQQEMGKVFSEIADNPEAFSGKNPQLYGQIQSKLAKLKSTATQSAQDKLFDDAHRNYLAQNPELNTDENAALVQGYLKKPLGQREAYTLSMPTIFDPAKYATDILANPSVTSHFATSELVGADGKPGDEFIKEVTGSRSSRDAFVNLWSQGLYSNTDKYGHSIQKAVKERYNMLPKDTKEFYDKNGGVQAFFKRMGELYFNSPNDIESITKSDLQANTNYVNPQELALKLQKQKFDEWAEKQRIAIGWGNLNKDEKENADAATSIVRLGVGILNDAVKPENAVSVYDWKSKKNRTLYKVSDPTLLKQFGTIDKDGTTTNVPDEVRFDPERKLMVLTYKTVKSADGNIIPNRIEEKALTLSDWTRQLTKGTYGEGKAGDIFGKVERFVNSNGGDIFELSKRFNNNKPEAATETKIPTGTVADFKGAGWTDDQINKAKAAGKIKVN